MTLIHEIKKSRDTAPRKFKNIVIYINKLFRKSVLNITNLQQKNKKLKE